MSKGAFYGYFESKRELMLALLDADSQELRRHCDAIAATALSVSERLRLFAEAIVNRGHTELVCSSAATCGRTC